jgi:putative transposase
MGRTSLSAPGEFRWPFPGNSAVRPWGFLLAAYGDFDVAADTWRNAWIESFNGRLRDEFLNGQQFDSLLEAQVLADDWRIDNNLNRPHSAHGWLTPVEFAEAWFDRRCPQVC